MTVWTSGFWSTPYALHTETNVRNCDRFCAHLGLDRNLIATTFGNGVIYWGQGDHLSIVPWHGIWEETWWDRYVGGYPAGSFKALPPDVRADGSSLPGSGVVSLVTGIFGTGEIDTVADPELFEWPFSFYGVDASNWRTGIVFHDKLSVDTLRIDQRFSDPND